MLTCFCSDWLELEDAEDLLDCLSEQTAYGTMTARDAFSTQAPQARFHTPEEERLIKAAMRADGACEKALEDFEIFDPRILDGKVVLGARSIWPCQEDTPLPTSPTRRVRVPDGTFQEPLFEYRKVHTPDGWWIICEMTDAMICLIDQRQHQSPEAAQDNEDHRGLDRYDVLWSEERPQAVDAEYAGHLAHLAMPGHSLAAGDLVEIRGLDSTYNRFPVVDTSHDTVTIDHLGTIEYDLYELIAFPIHRERRSCVDHRDPCYDGWELDLIG